MNLGKIITNFMGIYVGTTILREMASPFNRGMDLIGWTVQDTEENNQRQTYLEYVQERLKVERLMR